MGNREKLDYFILSRFNLWLWNKDKRGNKVRSTQWLEHRFLLFEQYCLQSIINQTCKEFDWIVLFDSKTPEIFKEKIRELQTKCPQLKPVFVEPEKGRYFAEIFRKEVSIRLTKGAGLSRDMPALLSLGVTFEGGDTLNPMVATINFKEDSIVSGHGYDFKITPLGNAQELEVSCFALTQEGQVLSRLCETALTEKEAQTICDNLNACWKNEARVVVVEKNSNNS